MGGGRAEGRGQTAELRIGDLPLGHMAAPSLGHYASLSFLVIGEKQRSEIRSQR